MAHELGVHSETLRLRTVPVCRPGPAHQRLTPGNCRDLLFDDVIWVEKARNDHCDFTRKMRDRGIEVQAMHGLHGPARSDVVTGASIRHGAAPS